MRALLLLVISYLYLIADGHIFIYHRFGDDRYPSTNTSIQELEKEFEYFKRNNYEVVPLQKIIQKVKNGEEVPSNWIALTIDDAYKSFYENGLPIFKKYNYPFTLYVYIKATKDGFKDFMTWEQLREVKKYGDVQLHGYDHLHLTKVSKNEVLEDTKKGMELFEKYLGYKPISYAYPYGEYNEEVKNTIASLGIESILNQNNGSINANSNLLDINRIALVGDVNIKEKLRYTTMEAKWIEPKLFPQDGILRKVEVEVNPSLKKALLYITGDTWRWVDVKNGKIDEKVNIPLTNKRTRVIIGESHYKINTQLLIK